MQNTPKINIIREIEELNRCLDELINGNFDKLGSQEWIKDNQSRFQTVIDTLPLYILYKDHDLRITKVNKNFINDSGIALSDIIDKTSNEIFPNLPPHYPQQETEILKNGNPVKDSKEFFFLKDGVHWLQVEKYPVKNSDGEITGLVVIAYKSEDSLLSEEKINESEQKYISLYNNAYDCIYLIDLEGNFVDANASALKLMNLPRSKVSKLSIEKIVSPGQIKSVQKAIEKLKVKELKSSLILKIKNSKGEIIQIETKANVIKRNGKPYLIQGVARDITKKLLVEEALRKSELIFRSVWENSVDAMRLIDENGTIILVNDAFCEMCGKERAELEGNHFSIIYKNKENENLLTNASHNYVEKELNFWNGKKAWFELSNTFVENTNSAPLLFSVFRNIENRKRTEAELRTDRDLIKSILESSPFAVLFLDYQANILNINKVSQILLGIDEDDIKLKGKSLLNYVDESYHARLKEVLCKTIESGIVKDFEFTLINAKKEELLIELSTNVVHDEIKNESFVVAILLDVTEKRLSEKQMIENAEALKELNASKDKFFSIISHDLRSPFQGMLGLSDLLSNDADSLSSEEILLISKSINKSLKNQLKLLENLLQWSRIQTGRIDYNPEKLNVTEIVKETFILLGSNATNKGIILENEVIEDHFVLADLSMVNSIIQNIVNNAIKFTNQNGTVKVELADKIEFVEIRISDTGIGMNEEDRKKIFRIDHHHSTTGTDNETGTGLGLILCKEMVERNGGSIKVESEMNKGTTFIFTLPKYEFDPENKIKGSKKETSSKSN